MSTLHMCYRDYTYLVVLSPPPHIILNSLSPLGCRHPQILDGLKMIELYRISFAKNKDKNYNNKINTHTSTHPPPPTTPTHKGDTSCCIRYIILGFKRWCSCFFYFLIQRHDTDDMINVHHKFVEKMHYNNFIIIPIAWWNGYRL